MPILAGQIITAGQLSRIQPRPLYAQAGSGTTITTTTLTDLVGCSIALTTVAANAVYTVTANFSFDIVTAVASGPYIRGVLDIDAVTQSGEVRWSEGTTGADGNDYSMQSKSWSGTLAAAGAHTFKLQSALNSATGSPSIQSTGFTDLTVVIYEVV